LLDRRRAVLRRREDLRRPVLRRLQRVWTTLTFLLSEDPPFNFGETEGRPFRPLGRGSVGRFAAMRDGGRPARTAAHSRIATGCVLAGVWSAGKLLYLGRQNVPGYPAGPGALELRACRGPDKRAQAKGAIYALGGARPPTPDRVNKTLRCLETRPVARSGIGGRGAIDWSAGWLLPVCCVKAPPSGRNCRCLAWLTRAGPRAWSCPVLHRPDDKSSSSASA